MKPKKRSAATAGGSQSAAKSALEIHPSEQGEFNSASADCEDVPIYFLHIPKTAGSSLTLFLQSLYRESEICGLFPGWAELLKIPAAEISKRKLIRGHFGANFRSHYPGALRSFTFLRDPLARALSHYEHVSRDAGHYFHTLARELGSFSAYMRDPRTQPTVANFQLRHLAADFQPAAIASTLSERQLAERELERRLDTSDLEAPLEVLLERAMQRLEHMCFVGITEQFDRSLGLLCEVFGWPPPDSAPVTNVNPRSVSVDDLSDADRKLLTDLNAADLALYAAATSRFERDWSRSKFVYPDLHAFVSHAQNFEDVMLHRALGHIKNGTYIDIGANDPNGDSVTRAFYDRGWSGINVEPVTALHEALVKFRGRDINLQIAAGSAESQTCLYEIPGTGLSTLDTEIAERHQSTGFAVVERSIHVQTLDAVLQAHPCDAIHFLKIDVEGWEHDVLRGIDFTRHRPWIVLVEATEPNSEIPSFGAWEPMLLSKRYRFAYFDGLNRFYVAEEHANLVSTFSFKMGNIQTVTCFYLELLTCYFYYC